MVPTGAAFFADRMRVMPVPPAVIIRREAFGSTETDTQFQQPLRTPEENEQHPRPQRVQGAIGLDSNLDLCTADVGPSGFGFTLAEPVPYVY